MSVRCWTLIGQTPVRERSVRKWAEWWAEADRTVARDEIGTTLVSTVFLGLDHKHQLKGPPMLFETMVFIDGGSGVIMGRCSTWKEAEELHALVVKDIRSRVAC